MEHRSNNGIDGSHASSTVDIPLRGFASEGAAVIIAPALRATPGVVDVNVSAANYRVRITYDPAQVTLETFQQRLHAIVSANTARSEVARQST